MFWFECWGQSYNWFHNWYNLCLQLKWFSVWMIWMNRLYLILKIKEMLLCLWKPVSNTLTIKGTTRLNKNNYFCFISKPKECLFIVSKVRSEWVSRVWSANKWCSGANNYWPNARYYHSSKSGNIMNLWIPCLILSYYCDFSFRTGFLMQNIFITYNK